MDVIGRSSTFMAIVSWIFCYSSIYGGWQAPRLPSRRRPKVMEVDGNVGFSGFLTLQNGHDQIEVVMKLEES
jgi:hypothetical protein